MICSDNCNECTLFLSDEFNLCNELIEEFLIEDDATEIEGKCIIKKDWGKYD